MLNKKTPGHTIRSGLELFPTRSVVRIFNIMPNTVKIYVFVINKKDQITDDWPFSVKPTRSVVSYSRPNDQYRPKIVCK